MNATTIGTYARGSVPAPLRHRFLKSDGTAIANLATWTPSARLRVYGGEAQTLSCAIGDGAAAAVDVLWVPGDLDASGDYLLEIEVQGPNDEDYLSALFSLYVRPSLAEEA